MQINRRFWAGAIALGVAGSAQASFHLMQIEQAIGGVGGDITQQAVQLRMRSGGQDQVQLARLRVSDATGANPVMLVDFTTSVANSALGNRILIASPNFASAQSPAPEFVMANLIPVSYLAGGRLTFESDGGAVIYSLCWGTYSGSTSGSTNNDNDGQYAPCEPGALPSSALSALLFTGPATATGTTNAADFALSSSPANFTNNAGTVAALVAPVPADRGGDCDDTNANVFRGHVEVDGNGFDDDCDGLADEDINGNPSGNTIDADGDGTTLQSGDCNDTNSSVNIGNPENVGDLIDNDCDTQADEDAANNPSTDAIDHDGDGYSISDRVFASGFENPN